MTWPTKKLGEVLIVNQSGIWGEKPKMGENAYPVIRSTEITHDGKLDLTSVAFRYIEKDKTDRFCLAGGDILVVKSSGSRNLIGRCTLFKHPNEKDIYLFSNFVQRLRPNNLVNSEFLYYFLNFEGRKFVEYLQTTTTGLRNLPMKQYLNLQIPIPPLKIQKRIVARIEELFEKIDKAKELRQKALEETEQVLPSALYEIFNKVEKKWGMRKMDEICYIDPSKSELKNLSDNLEVSFIPMSAVDDVSGSIITQDKKLLGKVKKGYTYFREGDVLFAKITPCMENGKSAIAKNLINGIGFGSTEFHILRPLGKVLSEWIYFYIRQPWFRKEAERHFTGTAGQQRVPQEFLEKTEIPLPPLSEQKKIVSYLDTLRKKVEKLKKLQAETATDLTELRASILSKAMKGELVK